MKWLFESVPNCSCGIVCRKSKVPVSSLNSSERVNREDSTEGTVP